MARPKYILYCKTDAVYLVYPIKKLIKDFVYMFYISNTMCVIPFTTKSRQRYNETFPRHHIHITSHSYIRLPT
jgi:hypothetical protein